MEDLINMIMTNGIGVVLIAYFIYRDYKFSEKITSSLDSIKEVLTVLKTYHGEE